MLVDLIMLVVVLKVGLGLLFPELGETIYPPTTGKETIVGAHRAPPAISSDEANPLTAAACLHRSLYTHLKKITAFQLSRWGGGRDKLPAHNPGVLI